MSAATPAERPDLRVVEPGEQPDVLSPVRRETGRLRTAWTAADLMGMDFPRHGGPYPASSARASTC
ncbi:hypothetical protein Phou_039890 [Phytohabitans houttuyneae]|uniref:Uncharacterized protein n=1 Tax=Phytohabitans houttuyneae TaxID=1076126 RepID=A0A6V8KCG9_9ACTN|nr:hypothetical protein Phou_039890 [Phytohabitans houttuyneae]